MNLKKLPKYIRKWYELKVGDKVHFIGVGWEGQESLVIHGAFGEILSEIGTEKVMVDFSGNIQVVHRCELEKSKDVHLKQLNLGFE